MSGRLRPRLVVLRGATTLGAREILPGEDWTLGRHADSPLQLQERSISRFHARIFCDAAGVHLQDLGTPNGTFLDGQPFRGVVRLRDGNVIRLGQSTNPDPLLVRFEDAGGRLLEAMVEPTAPAPAAEPGAAPEEATVITAPSAVTEPAAAEVGGEPAEALLPTEEPAAEPGMVAAGNGPLDRLKAHWKLAALGGAGLALVLWMIFALHVTQKPWQSVRVEPLKARAGGRVAIRGSEVEPSDSLKVFLEGKEAKIEEAASGQIVFTVPELAAAEAGTRAVGLRVERQGIVLLQQSLHYETVPLVLATEPREAAVGDTVSLTGSGFVSDPGRIKVRVGQVTATVLSASPEKIQFRVPVVTRSVVVDLPLEVRVGEWSSPPARLSVRPREAPCYVLEFTPRHVAEKIWEVRHPLGVALFLEGPVSSDPSFVPPNVQQAAEALRAVFQKAAADPTVHFEVKEAGRAAALVAVGIAAAPIELARWSPSLVGFVKEHAPELGQTELVPYWNSVVLNELLNVFVKKQAPRLLPADAPLRKLLQRLNTLNLENGGQGCPAAAEVQTISAEEREVLDTAALNLPARFGEVAGTWEGSLENVFAEGPTDVALELRLELQQAGTQIKARAIVSQIKGPGIRWSPAPIEGIEGRVKLGAETRIELSVQPNPPFHLTRLVAVLADGALEGTFHTAKNKPGRFRLQFAPDR